MGDIPIYGRLQAVFQDTLRLIAPLHQEPGTKSFGLLQGFTATVKYESTCINVKKRDCLEEATFMRKQDPSAKIGLVRARWRASKGDSVPSSQATQAYCRPCFLRPHCARRR